MKDKKAVMISLIVLTVISLGLGVTGFLLNKNSGIIPHDDPEEIVYNVTYIYYLDGEEVETMPMNPTPTDVDPNASSSTNEFDISNKYKFETYSCTNRITGEFDSESWTFIDSNTADGTCKLYFVSNYNKITYTANNATIKPLETDMIKRNENAVLTVTPNEGYVYEKTTCTNDESVKWNEEKKELTIENISKETSCEVSFVISKFTVEVNVENGSGSVKLVDKEYGTKIETNVAPSANYTDPTIECTNNIAGTWKDGKFVIEKITNNTVCKITFKQKVITSYTAELDLMECATIANGTNKITIQTGQDANWTIKVNEGFNENGIGFNCDGGSISIGDKDEYGTRKITLKNITANSVCTIICQKTKEE